MSAETRDRKRGARPLRPLIALFIGLVLAAVALEAGSRLLDFARGKPWDAESGRAAIAEICRLLSHSAYTAGEVQKDRPPASSEEGVVLQPYTGWEHPRTQEVIAKDVEYFREPRSRENFDVYVFGGSVAQLFAQKGTAKLFQTLHADPRLAKRRLVMHDYACAGYKQPQQATTLAYLLSLGHVPDAVINLDGFNEAALGWNNARTGTNPLYPSVPHWVSSTKGKRTDPDMVMMLHDVRVRQDEAREFGEWLLAAGAWRSAFLYHLGSLRLQALQRRYVKAYRDLVEHVTTRPKEAEIRGPRFPEDDEGIAEAIVTSWVETSLAMKGMCEVRGIPYLHVLQPTLHDRGSKPLTQKEIDGSTAEDTWIEGVVRVYPRLREAEPRITARGVAFYDASFVFQDHPEDVYYDLCHFGDHGNEILAVPVGEALLRAVMP